MPAIHRFPLLTLTLVACAAMLHCGVRGQAPAPAPAPGLDCTDSYYNLTDCLSYVLVGSNDTAPAKECCPEVAGLLESSPICLCELLAGGAERLGFMIDNSRAFKLRAACHLHTPRVSQCSENGIPVSSPMPPSPSPSGSIENSPGEFENSPGSSPTNRAPESAPPPATQNLATALLGAGDLAAAAAGASFIVGVLAIF